MGRILRHPFVVTGALMIAALLAVAFAAPLLAPHQPTKQYSEGTSSMGEPMPPSADFPLGTDTLGRDLLSRLIYGTRISLAVGALGMLLAMVIGTAVGVTAGYASGWIGNLLMRITDVMLAFPALLLALALVAVLKPSLWNVFIVIGMVNWTWAARTVRASTLSVRERDYVEAARALGASHVRVIFRHILPNVLPTVLVLASTMTAWTVMLDAGLSFLGLGVPPPAPSWGKMIAESQSFYRTAPRLVLLPGLAIAVTVAAFNLLGYGLRDILDPRSRSEHVG
jgi:ABC-type dipeptide/oligopeptide/nickel transport system permease subunit